jgi:uncharacterized protein (DUF885 family)
MIDRRQLLLSGAGTAALLAADVSSLRAAPAAVGSGGSALNALFDQFMSERLDRSPIFATSLGIDTGARAHQRHEVDDNSLAGIAGDKRLHADQLRRLQVFDRNSISGMDQLNYDVVMFDLQNTVTADARYQFGGGGAGNPYVISQLSGLYAQYSDFLDSQQPVENKSDADDYLTRLSQVGRMLDNDSQVAMHDVAMARFRAGQNLDPAEDATRGRTRESRRGAIARPSRKGKERRWRRWLSGYNDRERVGLSCARQADRVGAIDARQGLA